MTSTVENLKTALALLEEHGVGGGFLYNEANGQYCSLGAIYAARTGLRGVQITNDHHLEPDGPYKAKWPEMKALGPYKAKWPEMKALAETIGLNEQQQGWIFGPLAECIVNFNDTHYRSHPEEVTNAFRATIERLENGTD